MSLGEPPDELSRTLDAASRKTATRAQSSEPVRPTPADDSLDIPVFLRSRPATTSTPSIAPTAESVAIDLPEPAPPPRPVVIEHIPNYQSHVPEQTYGPLAPLPELGSTPVLPSTPLVVPDLSQTLHPQPAVESNPNPAQNPDVQPTLASNRENLRDTVNGMVVRIKAKNKDVDDLALKLRRENVKVAEGEKDTNENVIHNREDIHGAAQNKEKNFRLLDNLQRIEHYADNQEAIERGRQERENLLERRREAIKLFAVTGETRHQLELQILDARRELMEYEQRYLPAELRGAEVLPQENQRDGIDDQYAREVVPQIEYLRNQQTQIREQLAEEALPPEVREARTAQRAAEQRSNELRNQHMQEIEKANARTAAAEQKVTALLVWVDKMRHPLSEEEIRDMPPEFRPMYQELINLRNTVDDLTEERDSLNQRLATAQAEQRVTPDQADQQPPPTVPEQDEFDLPLETPRGWREYFDRFTALGGLIGFAVTETMALTFLNQMPELGVWGYQLGSSLATLGFLAAEASSRLQKIRQTNRPLANLIFGGVAISTMTSAANLGITAGVDMAQSNIFQAQPGPAPEVIDNATKVIKEAQAVVNNGANGAKDLLNKVPTGNFSWPDQLTVQGAGDSIWTTVGKEISLHLPTQLELSAGGQLYLTDAVKDIIISQYPDPQHIVHVGDVLNFSPDVQREIGQKILNSLEVNTKNPDMLKLVNEVDIVHLRQIGNLLVNVK